ncbi:MAG: hypothetical protein JWM05_791 [Acidimicrobiales bacterium]|nr:hypothetical protein [Acidimicrobiales bacterium]
MASIHPANEIGFDDPGPGVHVLVHPDPASIGEEISGAIEARLVMGGAEAVGALATIGARRATIGSREPAPGDPPRLRGMADAVRRADRIEDDTRSRSAERLAESLSTEVTVHPESLRRAATELAQAELALDRARSMEPPLDAAAMAAVVRPATSRTGPTLIAVGVSVLGLAAGGALTLAASPVLGVVVVIISIALALVIRSRLLAEGTADDSDHAQASEVLAHAVTLGQPPDMPAGPDASTERSPEPTAADAIDDALAELAAAHRRWEAVAGVGADPADLDEFLRRHDPQHDLVGQLLPEVPAVRATSRFARSTRERWEAAWAEFGEEPPDPPKGVALDDALKRILSRVPGQASTPMVLVEPFAGLSTNEAWGLKQDLLALEPRHTVILVVADEAHVPS